MIACVRRTSRNVKHWQSGQMALRWTAAGMLEAERQFRRIIGNRDLAKLAMAIEDSVTETTSPTRHGRDPRHRLSREPEPPSDDCCGATLRRVTPLRPVEKAALVPLHDAR
jgi:hypothetical protein